MTRTRLAIVASSGGHLAQLQVLDEFWSRYDRFWVTFDTPEAIAALADERTFWCYHPTNRSLRNLLRNSWLALRILVRERPTHIVSTGAAIAVPFFYLGRLFGSRTIYLEVFDRIDGPTLTGRLIRPVTNYYLVQWPEQQSFYPGAEVVGPVY
jgi:UDP-N-acetylglucosamine:LPS N-acetylglucosamine transferase